MPVCSFPARRLPPSTVRHGRAFCPTLRHKRFGPFDRSPLGFTHTLCHKGQHQLVLLPLVAHESRHLLAAPINPLRGPFGPSALACLIRPLLTSAIRSAQIASPSVL